ncbi:MAG: 16S rRNA (uracil(1498)-N(3))-methyltransferase [Planctomycetaceae bacterium]|nr:16S rRNA (uracil(1498)-N(3))-methyltransferase [Planctomycetaceae bacterium]
MTQRYFLSQPPDKDHLAVLDGDEARHLTKVMRKKIGEEVFLFDGSGTEYRAAVSAIARSQVTLLIRESRQSHLERTIPLTLATALPKGERQKWLVEKLTELGCTRLIPLHTELSVAKAEPQVVQRLGRYVIEASKQCGRLRLMEIGPQTDFESILNRLGGDEAAANLLIHPISDEHVGQLDIHDWIVSRQKSPATPGSLNVLIGPEGGFSPGEVQMALEKRWIPLDLGPRVLRTETAAIAVCAVLSAFK